MVIRKLAQTCLLVPVIVTSTISFLPLHAADGGNVFDQFGRFLGVGYSKQGYHSGRAVLSLPQRYRAPSSYPSYQLQQLYYRQYAQQPSTNYYFSQSAGAYQPFNSGNLSFGAQGSKANVMPENVGSKTIDAPAVSLEEVEPKPSVPKEPPPQWLKPYLDGQGGAADLKEQAKEIFEEDLVPSPSDDLINDDSLEIESGSGKEAESDDDLLLYDARRRINKPARNRYARPVR